MRRAKIIDLAPVIGADGDKEKGRIIALKNLIQPWRTSLNHAASVEAAVSAASLGDDVEAGVSPASSCKRIIILRAPYTLLAGDNGPLHRAGDTPAPTLVC